jgi:hypothetical protein
MTVILGAPTFIRAILDDIRASAATTGVNNGFLNHGISIRHHLLSNHYPLFIYVHAVADQRQPFFRDGDSSCKVKPGNRLN